jgi:hypothetical protein
MREFWAVVGKILVDANFHNNKLFPLCGYKKKFEDLDDLRRYLIKDLQLGFSRWEIMRLNAIVTERVNSNNIVKVDLTNPDDSIRGVQAGWDTNDTPPDLKAQFDFCSVIGLSSMDIAFREGLHDASRKGHPEDIAALKKFLEESQGDTPVFKLSDDDLKILNKLLRSLVDSMKEMLKVFHFTNWVQPDENPCDGGVTKTIVTKEVAGVSKPVIVPYAHFFQNGLNLLIMNQPQPQSVKDKWKESRAII